MIDEEEEHIMGSVVVTLTEMRKTREAKDVGIN